MAALVNGGGRGSAWLGQDGGGKMLERQAPSEDGGAERAEVGAMEEPARKRRGWLSALVAGMALVAVVVVFGALALGRSGAGTSGESALGASAAPVGWKMYRDPLGLYSIRIPASWTASVSYGTFTGEGDRTGSFSGKIEDVKLSDPALGAGSPAIYVHVETVNSAFGRQWYCRARAQETLSFNGYPATQIPPSGTVWLFESYNAHFQIDVEIPGVLTPMTLGGPMNPPPTPTAPPQATITADRTIIATALASFQPTAKPLTCG
jgi:hypothetical protein